MSLMDKMKKVGYSKIANNVSVLAQSKIFTEKDVIPIDSLPILNIPFSGEIDGGLVSGLTMFAGPTKTQKSSLGLQCMKAYLNKYKDAVAVFYDNEFGITPDYLEFIGIDPERIIHVPFTNIEELTFDISAKLDELKRGDHIIFFIDSIGMAASKKEAEDALAENDAQDMSRPKKINALFRIITPHLTMKNIPCIVINHVYQTQEKYAKNVISGGTKSVLAANNVFITGREQVKNTTTNEVLGYDFSLTVEKSRFVREKSKFYFSVRFEGGLEKYSGLFELALESGHIVQGKTGWYKRFDAPEDAPALRKKDMATEEFWSPIVNDPAFKDFVRLNYKLNGEKNIDAETEEAE